ncbi:hypothetical protein HK096_006468, partial [Nowakowskiella sp. JEL0078]
MIRQFGGRTVNVTRESIKTVHSLLIITRRKQQPKFVNAQTRFFSSNFHHLDSETTPHTDKIPNFKRSSPTTSQNVVALLAANTHKKLLSLNATTSATTTSTLSLDFNFTLHYNYSKLPVLLLRLELLAALNNNSLQNCFFCLASPHPAASVFFLEKLVLSAINKDASVIVLDYMALLAMAKELESVNSVPSCFDAIYRMNVLKQIDIKRHTTFVKSFSPSNYKLLSENDEGSNAWADEFDENEEDEDDEDDEDVSSERQERHDRSLTDSSDLPNVNVIINQYLASGEFTSRTFTGVPDFSASQPTFVIGAKNPVKDPRKMTFYNEILTTHQYQLIFSSLYDFIKAQKTPVVVHIKDMTEIAESDPENAARLLKALTETIQYARSETHQVIITAACSPPLVDRQNSQYNKNFYKQLFTSPEDIVSHDGAPLNTAEFYKTPLDAYPDVAKFLVPLETLDNSKPDIFTALDIDMRTGIQTLNLRNLAHKLASANHPVPNLVPDIMNILASAPTSAKGVMLVPATHTDEISAANLYLLSCITSGYLWDTATVDRIVRTSIGLVENMKTPTAGWASFTQIFERPENKGVNVAHVLVSILLVDSLDFLADPTAVAVRSAIFREDTGFVNEGDLREAPRVREMDTEAEKKIEMEEVSGWVEKQTVADVA